MNHAVFAEPKHQDARDLLADAYEQLGYLAECATWRNSYLFGAQELRSGILPLPNAAAASAETLAALTTPQIFDFLGVRLNGTLADGMRIILNIAFSDTDETTVLNLQNCALTHTANSKSAAADLSLVLTRKDFDLILVKQLAVREAIQSGAITFNGDISKFAQLFGLFETPIGEFAIVEP